MLVLPWSYGRAAERDSITTCTSVFGVCDVIITVPLQNAGCQSCAAPEESQRYREARGDWATPNCTTKR
ncbi:hypothetical protein Y032_0033g2739 [Ancylostoma ceylanicum]|uniref:Uncharacterized protein n=1 Tax=Ancylostoma ceylanicum TaxID=53326 RepID=A0A016UQ48_9BILA|nr:hypothetical protein Y032_0033g2739 [Ancylostoma ceylanicum]